MAAAVSRGSAASGAPGYRVSRNVSTIAVSKPSPCRPSKSRCHVFAASPDTPSHGTDRCGRKDAMDRSGRPDDKGLPQVSCESVTAAGHERAARNPRAAASRLDDPSKQDSRSDGRRESCTGATGTSFFAASMRWTLIDFPPRAEKTGDRPRCAWLRSTMSGQPNPIDRLCEPSRPRDVGTR